MVILTSSFSKGITPSTGNWESSLSSLTLYKRLLDLSTSKAIPMPKSKPRIMPNTKFRLRLAAMTWGSCGAINNRQGFSV